MGWNASLGAIAVSLCLLFIPGLIAGTILRLRGFWLIALSPAFSATLMLVASTVNALLSIPWSPLPVVLSTLTLAVLLSLTFRLISRNGISLRRDHNARSTILTFFAWFIPATILTFHTVSGITSTENISQTFDNIFHLNVVAYTLDTQNASPLFVGTLTSPESAWVFYPNLWHTFVSTVSIFSGVSVPVAVNAFNLTVLTTVWPLGALLLVRQFVPTAALFPVIGGLIAAFPAFPLYLEHYGVLYPYFLGISLLPAVLALIIQLLGLSKDISLGSKLATSLILLAVLPGIAVAHPGAAMSALALSVPLVCTAVFAGWQSLPRPQRFARIALLAVYGLAGLVMLIKLRPNAEGLWGSRMALSRALREVLLLDLFGLGFPIFVSILALIGIVIAAKSKVPLFIALIGMWAVSVSLYVVTAAAEQGRLKLWTAGPWYGDSPRLAPLVALSALLLASLSLHAFYKFLILKKVTKLSVWVAAGTIAVLGISQWGSGFSELSERMRGSYAYTENAALLSSDEFALLERVASEVPEDAVIVGSPWTGTSLAYAYADRRVLTPHIFTNLGPEGWVILNGLNEAITRPEVCAALAEERVQYVLDFGDHEVHGGNNVYPGLQNIDSSPAVELVDREGDAALFKIVACEMN